MNRSMKVRLAGLVLIALAFVAGQVTLCEVADAKGTRIEPPLVVSSDGRDPVLYVEKVHRGWFYVELASGATWMMTRCQGDEVTGNPRQTCWWNAKTMGNGEGRSFAVTRGVKHWAVRGTVVR